MAAVRGAGGRPLDGDAAERRDHARDQLPAGSLRRQPRRTGSGRRVALTFDDGPGASTAQIIRILQDEGAAATFFNIGVNSTVRPGLVQGEAAQRFLLGNHTWSHPDMATLSSADQATEMQNATNEQISLVGTSPCFFRPPYGSYNTTTLQLAQAQNMAVYNWSVDTRTERPPARATPHG